LGTVERVKGEKTTDMSFFDTIEKLQATGPERRPQETFIDPGSQEIFTVQQPAPEAKKKAAGRPEELSFLPPCQACGGRVFVFTDSGGLACSACQPEAKGQPVKSTGPDRPKPDTGLQMDAEFNTPSAPLGDSSSPVHQGHPGSARAEENFTAAWPWIKEHLPELLAGGWTRAALVGRGKLRHPVGAWGVAWLSVWREQLLTVVINSQGTIVFTYPIRGRMITKTAHKPNNPKKVK
jgi:hypothetical protein